MIYYFQLETNTSGVRISQWRPHIWIGFCLYLINELTTVITLMSFSSFRRRWLSLLQQRSVCLLSPYLLLTNCQDKASLAKHCWESGYLFTKYQGFQLFLIGLLLSIKQHASVTIGIVLLCICNYWCDLYFIYNMSKSCTSTYVHLLFSFTGSTENTRTWINGYPILSWL